MLFQSAATAMVYRLLNAVRGLATLPLVLGALSQTEFGVWIVVSQSVSLLALSDLGTGNAIGRFVARSRGLDDREGLAEVLSTVLAILLASGVLVAVLTFALAPHVPAWVGVGLGHRREAIRVFLIVGFGIAAQLPLRIALGVLIGHQLYGPHAIGKIAESMLALVGVFGLWIAGRINLTSLALITATAAVVSQCILLAVAWRMTRPWGLAPARVTASMAARLFGLGGSVLVATSATMLYTQGTVALAGRLIGVAAAGVYGVAFTVVGNLYPLITSMAIPLSTLSSEWQARNDLAQMRRTSLRVMRLTFAMSLCLAVGLALFGEPALRWWLQASDWTDADFTQAGRALSIMGVALAIGLPHFGSRSTLQGVGRHWVVSVGLLTASVVSLACGAAAMASGWGVTGAAIGWSVVWVIQGTVLFPPLISRYLDQPLSDMLRRGYLPGAVLGGIVAVTGYGLKAWVVPAHPLEYLLLAFPCIAVSLAGLVLIAPRRWTERLELRRHVDRGSALQGRAVRRTQPVSGRPLRVFFNYRTIEGPWGGANAFLRGLKRELNRTGQIEVVEDPSAPYDVFFINQLGRGPGRDRWRGPLSSPTEVARVARYGTASPWRRLASALNGAAAGKPIVCRLVNLRLHAYGAHSKVDDDVFETLHVTDVDVFQSEYVRDVFRAAGYAKPDSRVIYNGADQTVFKLRERPRWAGNDRIRVYSCTFTTRASKRFDIIAAVSELPGVDSYHIGAWPDGIAPRQVRLLGLRQPGECAALYREHADLFLHPAERDICPNVVVEALSSGLPVLYGTHGGTSEIVRDCGVGIGPDPGEALAEATERYAELAELVRAQHHRFAIERAAEAYAAAFQDACAARPASHQ